MVSGEIYTVIHIFT